MLKLGLETMVIALAVNVLTGLIKLPIKAFAKKMDDGTSLTKFIVFLPILLGAGMTLLYGYLSNGRWIFDKSRITVWLTSSSLSLSIYAILEKLFPSKRKILEGYEIEENKKLIETIKAITAASTKETCENVLAEVVTTVVEEQVIEPPAIRAEQIEAKNVSEEQRQSGRLILKGNRQSTFNLK